MWAYVSGAAEMMQNAMSLMFGYGVALLPAIMALFAVLVVLGILRKMFRRSVFFLGKDEQLRVRMLTETIVKNGPGMQVLNPLGYKTADRVKAIMLSTLDYVVVKDMLQAKERIERGPQLLYLGAYEERVKSGKGVTLSQTDYLVVENKLSGAKSLVKGPVVWFPTSPFEQASSTLQATALQEDEYIRIKDNATGVRMVKQGKCLLFLEPNWKAETRVTKAWTLKATEYVRLQDTVTGKITVHRGEKIVFPGPDEQLLDDDKLTAIDIKVNEYVKILDQTTGEVRVVSGINRVFLGPNEMVLGGGKQKAVQVDLEHAVLVRDTSSGQLRLVTEKQLFVPGAYESIEKVQDLICLADHEAVVIKAKDGSLSVHYGSPERQHKDRPRSFFLPPYAEIMELWWSSGLRRKKRDLCIERFDTRAQYMWFEFDCRTSDNVELVLESTIFWEVQDLQKLVLATGNLPGDIYNQARSQFIKQVAKVTLKKFMEDLHAISNAIFNADRPFYDSRGIKIHSLEVTKYKCSEARTSEVLQQIIEETTNRLNRLSQAESENEVNIFRVQGQIEHEKLNGNLLEIQHKHAQTEARAVGVSESERVSAFMEALEKDVPKLEDRITAWKVLRKADALEVVANGGGNLYYTPKDVDLSIRTDAAAASTTA